MAINKTIHYCWFGRGPLPEKEERCIATWRKHFPDYIIMFWNEDNFNYQECEFAEQAYKAKKFAFVSDYARAKLLYEYGGLYLDTDVKILKTFKDLLEAYNGLVGFERRAFIGTALIACQPNDPSIGKLLDYYKTHTFVQADGSIDNIANVSIFTDILKEKGLVLGGERQSIPGFEVFNREIFYPKKFSDTDFNVTEETVSIHMCSNSWLSERERKRGNNKLWIEVARPILRRGRSLGIKIIGEERIRSIEIKLRSYLR